ncbi:conserved hypothetical protein [Frankia canadensis]|uniref:Uncharacterized protein n=1 Tax=Frankia canadensis TaxID=1836972 RepID=A0A2I2KLZ3_9ACTN|nr:DUF4258 domain-containing protein [Frankia canadensis]SNQ46683.1 conserved hypothetical protein [Frankia canadensis]SOU53973.1 conserved hypothetical protein [Frankia canadensis]
MPDGGDHYRPVSRPYVRRFEYRYTEHVFDKLQLIDIALAEFERLLGVGEVIAEAPSGLLVVRELVLLIEWLRPLHVVVGVAESRRCETLITVYEPYPAEWSGDLRRRR